MPRLKEAKSETIFMIKNSKIKEFAKVGGMRVSSDFYDALNIAVGKLIIKACVSAKSDERATIRPSDLQDQE